MLGRLPKSLQVAGMSYKIRTDFRDVLTIVEAFEDPELSTEEKIFVCLRILYEDFLQIPPASLLEAYEQARWFLDGGKASKKENSQKIMDWVQDEPLIFAAVNKTAGFETRTVDYLHWWTFMGYFMEISDGTFSQVVGLRSKKASHKKLEEWEKAFWNRNKDICKLRPKMTEEEKENKEKLKKLLG